MPTGVFLALGSALVWGSGDFCGGRAATRVSPFQVLFLAALSGIAMLLVAALLARESLHVDRTLLWAAVAGLAGAGGILALYRGLAVGSAATVAPLAAVMAAVLPVVVGAATEGLPRATQLAGFGFAVAGIWLVARATPDGRGAGAGVQLGLLAGVGFGGFLVCIAQVDVAAVYLPLAVARTVMFATAATAMASQRLPVPGFRANPVALLAGVLDAGGNVLYLLARQHVRMDIAAILSSLYPVSTVILARVVSHEPVSTTQWVGGAVCLLAVMLIAS